MSRRTFHFLIGLAFVLFLAVVTAILQPVGEAASVAEAANSRLIGPNFPIGRTPGNQLNPDVAYSPEIGAYLVVWEEKHLEQGGTAWVQDICGQWVAPDGTLIGDKITISDVSHPNIHNQKPRVACTQHGFCMVVWTLYVGEDSLSNRVRAQMVSPDGTVGLPIAVRQPHTLLVSYEACDVAYADQLDRFLVVWDEENTELGGDQLDGRWLTGGGSFIGQGFTIYERDASEGHDWDQIEMAYNGENEVLVVARHWTRDTYFKLYGARIGMSGVVPDPNPSDPCWTSWIPIAILWPANVDWHDVSFSEETGTYISVWDQQSRTYGRHLDRDVCLLGDRQLMNRGLYPALACESGADACLLANYYADNPLISGSFWDSYLTSQSELFDISERRYQGRIPSLAYNNEDNQFLVVWSDSRNAETTGDDIYGQLVRGIARPAPTATPTPGPAARLQLQADPEEVAPDGHSVARIRADVLNAAGGPVEEVKVSFKIRPTRGRELGHVDAECTTNVYGRCFVTYLAPWPEQVFIHGYADEKVTIEAEAAGLEKEIDIRFIYLHVTETWPTRGTRNVDWEVPWTWAAFDRPIKEETVEENFSVQSLFYYPPGMLCDKEIAGSTVHCNLKLKGTTNADKGLFITAEFKAGPEGIRGQDGTFLRWLYKWEFYTTPKLDPSVIPVQVSEGAYLPPNEPYWIAYKPGVVRVHAGLDERWRIVPEDESWREMVLETVATPEGDVINIWADRRPLPHPDSWFETAWAAYREGRIYD